MNSENGERQEYRVGGMTCAHCEKHVREAVEALDGVIAAEASAGESRLTVTGAGFDDAAVAAAVTEAGYDLIES